MARLATLSGRRRRVRWPAMGDYFQNVVDVEATDEEAGPLGKRLLRWLIQSGIVVDTPSDNVLGAKLGYGPGRGARRRSPRPTTASSRCGPTGCT